MDRQQVHNEEVCTLSQDVRSKTNGHRKTRAAWEAELEQKV